MHQLTARVIAKQEISQGIFRLTVFAPQVAREAVPGQFVHVRCGSDQPYLFRRPFSVHQIVGEDTIALLVRVVGQGTRWLVSREPKESIDMIGPLGRGFEIKPDLSRAVLVAGGLGVAPLIFLAKRLAERKVKAYTLMGAGNRELLLDFMDLKRLTRRISVATDDGSQGHKGMVTDLLSKEIEEAAPEVVFACGPEAMLKTVAGLTRRHGVACQVSLEAVLACGVGACLGCAVKAKENYLQVCSDGPVFSTDELGW
jgi:dihydroorotate dehydrogenase electron transfer subunit